MKVYKKIILSIVVVFNIIIIISLSQQVTAISSINGITSFMKSSAQGLTQQSWFVNVVSTIIAFIQVAVVGIATIMFTVVGIQYFTTSAATAKAELRGRLTNVFIGGVIAFSALQLTQILFDLLN